MEGGRLRPSYGQDRHGVVPPKAPDIAAISVLQIRLSQYTIGRRRPRRFPPNAASRVMTTTEASQVGAFSLGKGRSDQLIGLRRVHLLQPLVLDGSGATGARMRALCIACSRALSG